MGKRSKLRKEGDDALVYEQLKEDVSAAVDAAPAAAVPETPQPKVAKKQRRSIKEAPSSPPAALAAAKPEENGAQNLDEEVEEVVEVKKRRKRSHKKIKQAAGPQESSPATEAQLAMIVEEVEETLEEVQEEIVVKKSRRRAPDPLPCTDPTHELLASLEDYIPPPRPVPNLGYACLCMDLRELKPPVFTSRDCIKRTFDAKGLPYIGELCLANCRDLARVIQWNHEHGIRFFRMSSVLWPWMGTFSFHDLPQKEEIAAALRFAGDLARKYDQRVTFHPRCERFPTCRDD